MIRILFVTAVFSFFFLFSFSVRVVSDLADSERNRWNGATSVHASASLQFKWVLSRFAAHRFYGESNAFSISMQNVVLLLDFIFSTWFSNNATTELTEFSILFSHFRFLASDARLSLLFRFRIDSIKMLDVFVCDTRHTYAIECQPFGMWHLMTSITSHASHSHSDIANTTNGTPNEYSIFIINK